MISAGLVGCWLLAGLLGNLDFDKDEWWVVALVVAEGVAIVAFGVAFGMALVALVAEGVAGGVEKSLKTGTPSWVAIFVFLLLITAHLFLIYYCFLDGWRLFV